MFADRIRGGAGFVFAVLALLLLRGGPGFSEGVAAPGCKDDASCYAETREEGVMGPNGIFVTSHTITCQGECLNGGSCAPADAPQNSDGSRTYQCSCDPNSGSGSCSGIATVEADGQVRSFSCGGDCGSQICKKQAYNLQTDRNCPQGGSQNRKCICE